MIKSLPFVFTALLFIAGCREKENYPQVSTFAGTGAMGKADGTGTSASFANLMGLAIDTAGNIFVADSHNNLVRKITPGGVVTTIAGNGNIGAADGTGAAASFFNPEYVAVDKSGNIYVSDTHNSLIRKITQAGVVTTIAGRRFDSGTTTKDTSIKFDNPAGIAVDEYGNVYVADWGNDRIRKITASGRVTNFAGCGVPGAKDGVGDAASFYLPWGIAVNSAGSIFVADSYNNMIRKISPVGVVTTFAGKKARGANDGKDTAASFFHPAGIAIDAHDNIYVADAGNNKIRKITAGGVVTTIAGSGLRGFANGRDTAATFYRPYSVVADKNGNVFVADYLNNVVRKISF